MEFSRQEYWSGLPCPPPGDLPHSGIKPASPVAPALQVDSLLLSHWKRWCITGYQLSADSKQRNISMWSFSSVQFGHSVLSDSVTPWTAACQASLSITNSWSLLKPMPIELVMPFNHLILCCAFSSCSQSFPASGSFQMSQLFESSGQSIGVSASALVLLMNIQDWFPLGWTGWISLESKGLSRVFSNTTVQKHQFFCTQLFYSPTLTSIHDSWKSHSLD